MYKSKIIFFGSSSFSSAILETILKKYNVAAVVTQPERIAGRNKEIVQTAVSETASKRGLLTFKPEVLKDQRFRESLAAVGSDMFVVLAYGKIIPKDILNLAKKGAINIHPSLLPKYRGPSPIHAVLLNGDAQTGVSIILMDEQMDHGPVLIQRAIPIAVQDKFPELEAKLCKLSQEMIIEALDRLVTGSIQPKEQNHADATFCKIITKEDGKIDWSETKDKIYNKFRAFVLWPGIWTTWSGKILKITNCAPSAIALGNPREGISPPGTVRIGSGKILMSCSNGSLEILELQLEGRRRMQAQEFLNGHADIIGARLGV